MPDQDKLASILAFLMHFDLFDERSAYVVAEAWGDTRLTSARDAFRIGPALVIPQKPLTENYLGFRSVRREDADVEITIMPVI